MSNAAATPQDYASDVREQYEDYPYPYRDVEKEGQTFAWCDPESLLGLNHIGWSGGRNLRKGARILVAGCGTGDSTISFAEEIYGGTSEIVAVDLSAKSIEISKARVAKRKLKNVTFHHLSILDLPAAGLGKFDIIESSGVLHHLPDPAAGLSALGSVLKDDGLMALMVYGQHGRMSVYLVQALMKELMTADMPRAEKIDIARAFLNNVPVGHWLTVNNANFLEDMRWPDGSGIYDLFLHSHDRAYTVPQIYEWVEGCGLTLVEFFGEMADDSLYAPEHYNASPMLREVFAGKSLRERQEIAELMHGNMAKHYFYVAKQHKTPAQPTDDMVMTYAPMQELYLNLLQDCLQALGAVPVGQRIEAKVKPFGFAPSLFVTKTPHVERLMMLIDGARTIGEMIAAVVQATGATPEAVRADLELLYREYRARQVVFLRHKHVPRYPSGQEIIGRFRRQQAGGK